MRVLSLRSSTSSKVTESRNAWIWLPSSSQIVGQAFAAIGTAAGGTHLGAACRLDRLVDRQDDLRDTRLVEAAGQAIAAAWATNALHQAGTAQAGKELLQIGQRDFLSGGNIRQRHRLGLRMTRQIDHRHHGVTTLGAELHSNLLMSKRRKVLKTKALLRYCGPPRRDLGKDQLLR